MSQPNGGEEKEKDVNETITGIASEVEKFMTDSLIVTAFYTVDSPEAGENPNAIYVSGPAPDKVQLLNDPLNRRAMMVLHGFQPCDKGSYHWRQAVDNMEHGQNNFATGKVLEVYAFRTVTAKLIMEGPHGVIREDASWGRPSEVRVDIHSAEIHRKRLEFAKNCMTFSTLSTAETNRSRKRKRGEDNANIAKRGSVEQRGSVQNRDGAMRGGEGAARQG